MASPMTIAQFSNLIDPAVQKHVLEAYSEEAPKLENVFKVESQDVYNDKEMTYAGLAMIGSVNEGQTIPEDSFIEQYATTYTPTKYSGLVAISYETKLFERMDLVSKVPREAGKAAAWKEEQIAADVLNHAFGAYTSYGDGDSLCDPSHNRADGGTAQSNASTTGIPFSEANLETAMIAMEESLSDRGNVLGIFADKLIVPLALRKEALIVTKSDLRSGTANNDMNVYNASMNKITGGTIPTIIIWKRIGAFAGGLDTQWFLQDSRNHQLKFKWADKISVEKDDSVGFKNDVMYWKVRFMASTGWSDWRGFWGSEGDGSTLS